MGKIVIFDLVGTLFPISPVSSMLGGGEPHRDCWFHMSLQTAMAATLAERYIPFREAVEMTLTNLLEQQERTDISVPEVLETFQVLPPAEGAKDCLKELRRAGCRLAVLTNSARTAAQSLLNHALMAEHFEMIISTDDVQRCKPHPAAYGLALDRMDVAAEDAWLVAAHGWDIYGATAAGLHTVWMMTADRRWPFPGVPPGMTVSSFTEIPGALGEGRSEHVQRRKQ